MERSGRVPGREIKNYFVFRILKTTKKTETRENNFRIHAEPWGRRWRFDRGRKSSGGLKFVRKTLAFRGARGRNLFFRPTE